MVPADRSNKDMNPRVLVAGASNLDRICRLDSAMADGASIPGRVSEFPGGAGLNVASNLAAFGLPVTFATVLGADTGADALRKAMKDRGVTARINSVDVASASYTAILQPEGDLVVAVNDMDIYQHFDAGALNDTLAGFGAADWLVVDANLKRSVLEQLSHSGFQFAALTVSTTKAPRLRNLSNRLDLLFTNRREALALAEEDVNGAMDRSVRALRELGIRRAVISDGASPVAVLDDETSSMIALPDCSVVRDVTGAGDALAAGTLWRLMAGEELCDAVRNGIAAAQVVLQVDGPWRKDLAEAIDAKSFNTMKVVRLD